MTVGVDVTGAEKVWRTFQAIGDIAFAYAFSTVLIEIQVSSTQVLSLIYIYIIHAKQILGIEKIYTVICYLRSKFDFY